MSKVRYFEVTQTRVVRIWANEIDKAACIATELFHGSEHPDIRTHVREDIREIELKVREEL